MEEATPSTIAVTVQVCGVIRILEIRYKINLFIYFCYVGET